MKPYEIIECLNQLFSEFDRLAEMSGVEKIKTSGDSYMAIAGIPSPKANHALTATELALDMIEVAGQLHLRLPEPFSIRVGLHSGPVMAGVIGTQKFTYDVWGDTVNIAARMEAASRPNRVLSSASTAKALGRRFHSRRAAQNCHQGRARAGSFLRRPSYLNLDGGLTSARSRQRWPMEHMLMPLRFRSIRVGLFVGAVLTCTLGIYGPSRGGPNDDVHVAESLSTLLQVARTVVSRHQNEINNPDVGDKGFTGQKCSPKP